MLSSNQGEDSSNTLNTIDPDKARLHFVLHWLQLYLEKHPTDRDVVVNAVTSLKLLPTPTSSTPSNTDIPSELAPTPTPSQYIKQEARDNPNSDATLREISFINSTSPSPQADHNQNESLSVDPHYDQEPPATQRGTGTGAASYQAYVEGTNESNDDFQPPENCGDWPPTGDSDCHQDVLLPNLPAASSISQHPNPTQYKSCKRKCNVEGRRNRKRLQVDALDRTEADLGRRSPQPLASSDLQPKPDRSNLIAGYGSEDSPSLITSPTSPEAACSTRGSPVDDNPLNKSLAKFTELPADLRAKVQMIGDIETLSNGWHFLDYMGSLYSSPTNCHDTEPNPFHDVCSNSLSDRRLVELKVGIIIQENAEKSMKRMKIATRVLKRVYLAELAGKYMEETTARKAKPRKRREKTLRPLSVKNKYTDLLFPETITHKGKQMSKEENGSRKKAKEKLEYCISLGEPLAMMAQRYGIGIILLLPMKLTDKDLHLLPRHYIETFLDYIDFLHPGLRENINNLSVLLPSIVETGLPSQRIVIETYTSDQLSELSNRPLKELFQIYTGVDSQRAYAMANSPLGHDSSIATNSEYPGALAPQEALLYPLEIDQLLNVAVKQSFGSQDVDLQVNMPSDVSAYVDRRSFALHPANISHEMGWASNNQDTRTVNPKDLLLEAPLYDLII